MVTYGTVLSSSYIEDRYGAFLPYLGQKKEGLYAPRKIILPCVYTSPGSLQSIQMRNG